MTQSFNIPDSFSADQLKEMMSEAIPEEIAHKCELCDCDSDEDEGPHGSNNLTDDQVINVAAAALDEAAAVCDDPIVHKVMMHMIIDNLLAWHKTIGEKTDIHAWSRDAGKFQAIANILSTIGVSDHDFTCDQE
tara:strand:- start:167 stop:568 length:402 start_codon:yes stop_codon:yes gene_type:complete